jgi:arylsulfatase A-like enzyme
MRKNLLFIVVDAMRYDVLAETEPARILTPNLARLAETGILLPCIANAQATQFVMPSLFSSTYPLDHGGYNDGILGRPASFVEQLKEAGYQTCLASSCNILSSISGYQRGFEEIHAAIDYRHILDYRIDKTHSYHLRRLKAGEIDAKEASEAILPAFERELAALKNEIDSSGKKVWGTKLRRYNEWIAAQIPEERRLIQEDPDAVFQKLLTIPPVLYWRWLGDRTVGAFELFRRRIGESFRWRWKSFAVKRDIPFFWVSHQQVLAEEVVDGLVDLLPTLKAPWYAHMHVMDVHDFQSLSRPINILRKLRFIPRCLHARRVGRQKRHMLYDLALCYIDREVGKLVAALERTDQRGQTMLAVMADHGSFYAGSPRYKRDVALRTNFEDIDIPLLLNGIGDAEHPDGLIDTMGVSATLLEICGVPQPESFKGTSLGNGGRNAVITESAGGGNADLVRRDLYFTITTRQHRLMTVLRDKDIEVFALYDRLRDPNEKDNLVTQPEMRPIIAEALEELVRERAELFELRNVDIELVANNWLVISPEEVEKRL